jgi:hypothetical protein
MQPSERGRRLSTEDLEAASLELLIANGLKALRDPASRGPAVSYSDLEREGDGSQRKTLRSFLAREYAPDVLPFDLAAMRAFRGGPWNKSGTSDAMNMFATETGGLRIDDVSELRPIIRQIMLSAFEADVHQRSRDLITGSLLVHAATIVAGPLENQDAAAQRLASIRLQGLDEMTLVYASALRNENHASAPKESLFIRRHRGLSP